MFGLSICADVTSRVELHSLFVLFCFKNHTKIVFSRADDLANLLVFGTLGIHRRSWHVSSINFIVEL